MSKVYTQKIKSQFGADGENFVIKLPDELLKEVGFAEGDCIEISHENGSLVLKKADMVEIQISLNEHDYETIELAALKINTTVQELAEKSLMNLLQA